jgi:DNA-binding NarL/FixJ family response regulator
MAVHVLLIDDHDDARRSLSQRLQRSKTVQLIGAVANVEEARAVLANQRVDVILLDLHRHDSQGIELGRALRELTDAPMVALTSFMTPELWTKARAAGFVDYLLKHVDTQRLSREIARLAQRHRDDARRHSTVG